RYLCRARGSISPRYFLKAALSSHRVTSGKLSGSASRARPHPGRHGPSLYPPTGEQGAVRFPTPALEKVLGKTLGVPLFQEQAMQVAMVAAGFSANEADQLRRSMATFKFTGGIHKFQEKLITGMLDNGYEMTFAERIFRH